MKEHITQYYMIITTTDKLQLKANSYFFRMMCLYLINQFDGTAQQKKATAHTLKMFQKTMLNERTFRSDKQAKISTVSWSTTHLCLKNDLTVNRHPC